MLVCNHSVICATRGRERCLSLSISRETLFTFAPFLGVLCLNVHTTGFTLSASVLIKGYD